jgi:hypothetical protein
MCLPKRILVMVAVLVSVCAFAGEKPPAAVELVARLYKEFAWETVIEEPLNAGPGFTGQPARVLAKYLDPELVSLLVKDRMCAAKAGLCKLDFLPLWDAQDVGATELKVLATADPKIVVVQFKYPSANEQRKLRFEMRQTAAGLRIHDIKYQGGTSLRQILGGKP